jgi:hypothetical protein
MKIYSVKLKDGRDAKVLADSYTEENGRVIFKQKENDEIQYFLSIEVIGVFVASADADAF